MSKHRRLGLFWGAVSLTLSLAVACGGGDDDDDDVAYCETCAPTAPNPPPDVAVDAPTGNPAAGGLVGSGAGDSVGGNESSFNGGAFGSGGTSVGSGGTSSLATGGGLFTTGGSAFAMDGSPGTGTPSFGGSAAFGGR